jgi:hypothetical protein
VTCFRAAVHVGATQLGSDRVYVAWAFGRGGCGGGSHNVGIARAFQQCHKPYMAWPKHILSHVTGLSWPIDTILKKNIFYTFFGQISSNMALFNNRHKIKRNYKQVMLL